MLFAPVWRGIVQGGVADQVDAIDVGAGLQEELDGVERIGTALRFGHFFVAAPARTKPRSDHQRRRTILGFDGWIRALLHEQPDDDEIGRSDCSEQGVAPGVTLMLPCACRGGMVLVYGRFGSAPRVQQQRNDVQTRQPSVDFRRIGSVAVGREIAHLDGDVERAVVDVRTLLHQKGGHVVVAVEDGRLHGRKAVLRLGDVEVSSRGQQNLRRLDGTLAGREHERA